MDIFRRIVLPVIVIVVLLAALVYRLSSCSPRSTIDVAVSPSAGTETPSSSPTETPDVTADVSAAPKPVAPYDDDEINSIYMNLGLSVAEIRDADDVTMVHYYKPTGIPGEIISRFDWFDRSTGERTLVYGWAYTEAFDIKPDKTLTVLTTGLSHIDGALSFPKIFRSGYAELDGAMMFTCAEEKYYAPLDKNVTIGKDRREALTDIHVNPDFVSIGFDAQPGYEAEFFAAYESLPKMTVVNEDGYSTVTLYKTVLSKDFVMPSQKENAYCSLVSVTSDGTDTVLTLKLNEASVSRYNIGMDRSPATDLPYAVLEFTNLDFDYPSGW